MRIRAFPVSISRVERTSSGRGENPRAVDRAEQQATAGLDLLRLRLRDLLRLWNRKYVTCNRDNMSSRVLNMDI